MIRLAISASAKSRSRDGVRDSSRGRSSLRIMPITAATCPCGKARWISNTSSGRTAATREQHAQAIQHRRRHLAQVGQVRFVTFLPSR